MDTGDYQDEYTTEIPVMITKPTTMPARAIPADISWQELGDTGFDRQAHHA